MVFLVVSVHALLLLLLSFHSEAVEELRARPYSTVTLPCYFSFVDGTDDLSFSWEKEDIKEEYEVEDDQEYYQYFLTLHDFYEFSSKVVYSFSNNQERLEEQSSQYEGRVQVDWKAISQGSLSLLLEHVNFPDQAIYKCTATSLKGRGERIIKLLVDDAEEPQVQFSTNNDKIVVQCISEGWYHMPKVTWHNRKEEDLTSYSTVEILEEKKDGAHRVLSILKYPVKLHEIYICHIKEEDELNRPVRAIHKIPKRRYSHMYDHY
ncbi:butyrophilin subfamily 2 member A2-like isoform X1 [Mauremys reevesii]|uniref:butyrophilin subfamily 2 member A2-like isoform X1 n=1 Tax=Mauremys reevesii TaxID=260615 RepID=UPI00193F72AA|nr:butyrophilin subfamily 2 member A2-like isoform X1 [Mauremys reevesii]XP_039376939.1 butyrophilin subfamily 2 member A2-like isoform X1 [Mauremys reevesii]